MDCKEIKPGNPKEINPQYSLEGMMLKLKLQYFGHLMQRSDSLEKTDSYGERCQIRDLQRRLTSGPGTRLDHSRAFV